MKLFIVLSALLALGSADLQDPTGLQSLATEAETTDLPELLRFNEIPNGYQDSTHQVFFENGMRIEVDETISKGSDEGEEGTLVAQILIKVAPGAESRSVEGKPDELPSDIKSRVRRELIEYVTRVGSNANCHPSAQRPRNPTYTPPPASPLTAPSRPEFSYIGDTNVNYLGEQPKENPDAEVFDINLVKKEEERFYAGRPRPASYSYQPVRSHQPVRSQGQWSQPIRSQPIRSQPIRSQAQWSQPIRSQPLRTHGAVYSHSIRSQPLRYQPLRSQPLRSQSIQSQPIQSQPLRSQPIQSQPLRSQPIQSQPLRSQSIQSQPIQSQTFQSQPLRSQPIRSLPLMAGPIQSQPPRTQSHTVPPSVEFRIYNRVHQLHQHTSDNRPSF